MAYATATDLTARYDERSVADLASDTGEPVEELSSCAVVTAALDDASGRLEAACMVSELYTTTQLAALTGNSLALCKRITCDLAMAYLMARRPERVGSDALKAAHEHGESYLEMLRKGQRLFGVDALVQAGKPEVDGPTTTQYSRMNLVPDRTRNFYPARVDRLPTDRT